MSVNINNEELKPCLLKGCESTFINKEDVVLEVFDRFFFEKEDLTDTLQHPTKWWKTYDVGTLHEVSGRISFMWLTEDGRAIRSDRGSHFTILNWALYNYLKDKSEEKKKEVLGNMQSGYPTSHTFENTIVNPLMIPKTHSNYYKRRGM